MHVISNLSTFSWLPSYFQDLNTSAQQLSGQSTRLQHISEAKQREYTTWKQRKDEDDRQRKEMDARRKREEEEARKQRERELEGQ